MRLPDAARTPRPPVTAGSVLGLLRAGSARLEHAGVPGGRRDAAWLLAGALGTSPAQLHLDAAAPVPVAAFLATASKAAGFR